ncbi:MAG: hypothetical protein ACP5H5_00090 [Pyrobaculum sp.]
MVSHSYREFQKHLGYVKLIIRFPDWDLDESKTILVITFLYMAILWLWVR